jgi:hypothetical protein
MIDRRAFLLALPVLLVPALLRSRTAGSAPAAPGEGGELTPEERKLANRLELWSSYAKRTQNLLARLSTRRETSLLTEPLEATGTLLFRAPSLLVLRDDGRHGSTTIVDGDEIRIVLNHRDSRGHDSRGAGRADPTAVVADHRPAAQWLARRLLHMFAPGDGTALVEGSRTHVPKGHGHRLELMPPIGSTTRRQVRSVSMHLDPVVGAVTQIVVAEAQGDRVLLGLSDHRQNLPDEDIDAVLRQLDA